MRENRRVYAAIGWLALFTSTGTLICCAIPILLVSLGFGAVVAALTMQYPLLVTLSDHSIWMFSGSFALLALTAGIVWRQRGVCPADPVLAKRCEATRTWSKRVFWLASALWITGFIAAFALLPLRDLIAT